MTKELIAPSVFQDLQDAMGKDFAAELLETFLSDADNMFSGSASTTGPGRPERANWNARAMYSGSRSVVSTSATHLARPPNICL